jgi:hypothetical protein
VAQFLGILMIAVGALIAVFSGLCTLTLIGLSIANGERAGDGIGPALVTGGVPALFGGIMIWLGSMLLRSGRKPRPPANPATSD